MNVANTILEYFRLMRPQGAAQTAVILLLGSLIMGQRDIFPLFILFLIGFLSHVHGFVLNDYADAEVDKKSSDLEKKPLVSGTISKRSAIFIIFLTAFCSYFLTIFYFYSVVTLLLLTLAAICSGIYNFFGKKILGSEIIISLGLALFCLYGASTVSLNFTNVAYIVSSILFIEGVFIHVVEGGVKDVDHDYLAKAKTIPTIMGVKVKDGKLFFTKKFLAISYLLKIIFFVLVILLGLQKEINVWNFENPILLCVLAILAILEILTFYKFITLEIFDRSKIKKLYAAINSFTLALIFVILYPIFNYLIILILLLLPISWYTVWNYVLYGKAFQPRV